MADARERPIIFSAPMVRAILDGRKTMTRRIIKPQPWIDDMGNLCSPAPAGRVQCWGQSIDGKPYWRHFVAKYVRWRPGDRAWVRETWAPLDRCTTNDPGVQALVDRGFYRADDSTVDGEISHWTPAIHMPRRVSRLTLLIENVRVQRLQDISEEDARAEGVERHGDGWRNYLMSSPRRRCPNARDSFSTFWTSIHGPDAWDRDPWVVALTFRPVHRNIDQMEPADAA